jgi:MoaA/NifB/PqqE/SkfB family radical SAM enzyme
MVWSQRFSGSASYRQIQQKLRDRFKAEPPAGQRTGPSGQGRIDADGRIVLPDPERRRWGLSPDTELIIQETAEGLVVRPVDPPLKKICVEPTSACNLSCRTCVRNTWEEETGFMDMATFRRMISGLKKVPSLEKIAFWGIGEPLLHPDIFEMIFLANRLGVKTELVSNALLLDRPAAEKLVETGLDTLVVSVDGVSSATYKCIRSGGNLDTVKSHIDYLNTLRWKNGNNRPDLGIEFVAMQSNLSELPKLRDLAYEMKASFLIITNVLPYTEALKDEILYWLSPSYSCFPTPDRSPEQPEVVLPVFDDRPEQMNAVKKLLQSNGIVTPSSKDFGNIKAYCPFVWEGSTSISWDGSVSPCIALMHSYTCYVLGREKKIRRYPLGNIGTQDLKDIWSDEAYKQFRNRAMRFEFSPCANCGGCEFADFNEEDCFGNTFPVCGDCLWARGIILCP